MVAENIQIPSLEVPFTLERSGKQYINPLWWRFLRNFQRGVGGFFSVNSSSPVSTASVTFTNLTSAYSAYVLLYDHVKPQTDAVFLSLRTSTDNGVNYDTGASDYVYALSNTNSSGTVTGQGSSGSNFLRISTQIGNSTNEETSGILWISKPADSAFCKIWGQGTSIAADGSFNMFSGGGQRSTAADVTAIQILMSSGNINSGNFFLYGIQS